MHAELKAISIGVWLVQGASSSFFISTEVALSGGDATVTGVHHGRNGSDGREGRESFSLPFDSNALGIALLAANGTSFRLGNAMHVAIGNVGDGC